MQGHLNELCLAGKEQNHNCRSCEICAVFNFSKMHWKRTEKPYSHAPSQSPQCRNQRELMAHAVGRALLQQCPKVNHDADCGLPKQLFGCHHLLWQLLSCRREQDAVGSSQQLCLARGLNIPDLILAWNGVHPAGHCVGFLLLLKV